MLNLWGCYNSPMTRKILRFPHPDLRKKSKAVKRVTPEIVKLIDDLIETMHLAPGVGLAAPQIGESVRVIVADIGEGPIALVIQRSQRKGGSKRLLKGV